MSAKSTLCQKRLLAPKAKTPETRRSARFAPLASFASFPRSPAGANESCFLRGFFFQRRNLHTNEWLAAILNAKKITSCKRRRMLCILTLLASTLSALHLIPAEEDSILQHRLRTSSSISDAFSCLRRWHVVLLEATKHQEPAVPAL